MDYFNREFGEDNKIILTYSTPSVFIYAVAHDNLLLPKSTMTFFPMAVTHSLIGRASTLRGRLIRLDSEEVPKS
jgi:hypothetical protein